MTKHHYLQMLFAIIFSAICIAFAVTPNHQLTRAGPNSTKNNVVVCPLNLTESLPCFCHVLPEGQSVQIICKNTQPKHVWTVLGGYSAPINKMAIRNCPNRTEIFHPVPDLKIRSLVISSCPISQFSPNAFDSLATSMEELWLLNNTLTSSSIPQLGKLLLLKALNLNMNEIVTFPDATLRGLKNLTQLRLRSNRICNLINPLQDQKNSLVLLDLSHNCLGAVPASALRGCLQLKHMSLANNQLTEIGSMQLMSLPELIELRLQGNRLQRIVPNGFMNVPKLQQLFLHENSLSFFDPGTLQAHKELQLVDLRANAFTTIPSFKDMAELTEVRLDHNRICAIETLAFSSNPKLTRISLAGNQISEIAKNSFDSLDQLEWLDLADNALATIGPGRLEGMRQLHDLILRNNSIEELNRQSFASVPQLVGLDLSHNELKTLRAGTFGSLQRLRLLKLEHNQLETVEKGAFVGKVDTVLLDGNQLRCDSQLDWFIDWLVAQKVRTFVPSQPEIKCAGPGDKEGTRLKDLMMERNNGSADEQQETNAGGLTRGGGADPMTAGAGQMLANLIPGIHQAQGAQVGTQLLNSLASKYRMPGLNFLAPNTMASQTQGGTGMESVIDQFSEPIVKFASGVQPSPADVNKLLQSLPSLMVNVPGFGNVDVSKLNPSLVEYVLKGGQIPGIPRETLTQIVKQYMQRLYVAAAQAQGIPTTDMPPLPPGTNASRVLRPIAELPHGLVQSVMEGNPLPHLSTEQTSVIREYYTQHAPVGQLQLGDGGGVEQMNNLTNLLSPKVIQMMQLLPRNYNLSKLPPDLVRQVMQGEMPDLTRLPVDLQQHIKDNFDRLIASLENTPDLSIEEILKKLPRFEQPPNLSTFSPYDINAVDSELVTDKKKSAEQARFWRTCAAVALGLACAVTLGVLSAFCCCWPTSGGNYYPGRFHSGYWHRTGGASIRGLDSQSGEPGRGLPSVVREQSFRPSANSTLK